MKVEMHRFGKPYDPGKEKRKKKNALFGVLVFLIIAVVIVALASIEVEIIIRRYIILGQEETWTASVASYWGGIIGGVVSGILAFLGVFYTIRYYKESDAQKLYSNLICLEKREMVLLKFAVILFKDVMLI